MLNISSVKKLFGDISLKIVTYLALFLSHEHFRIWVTCAVVKTTSANNNFKLNVIKTVLFEGCLGRKLQKKDVLFLVLNCYIFNIKHKNKQTTRSQGEQILWLIGTERSQKQTIFLSNFRAPLATTLQRRATHATIYRYREVKNRLYNHHNGLPVATLTMTLKKLLILTDGNVSHTFCSFL